MSSGKLKYLLAGLAAGAAAVFFSDKKNRESTAKKAKELKGKAVKEIEKIKKQVTK